MLFNQFNWMDIEHYLEQDSRVVVLTGTCHQHAYLSLTTGLNTPLMLARVVCADLKVLIAPPLSYGISDVFSAYPGTVSLNRDTFTSLLTDVLTSLIGQGFRRVLVSNGHGGNTEAIIEVMDSLREDQPKVTLELFEWFRDHHVLSIAEKAGLPPNHGNWFEKLPFNEVETVRELPSEPKPNANLLGITDAEQLRAILGDGSFGGPYQADDAVVETLINVAAEGMAIKLRMLKQSD